MLRLFQPVVLEQALELMVEILIVPDAFDVMPERDPLDMQDRNPDSQRTVGQDKSVDIFCRTDKVALAAETCFEFLPEALEKMNMLRLFAGELEQSTDTIVVARELRPCMVDHVRENELLDQAEHGEVFMAPDLV